jgi:hypothetical protein
MPANTLNDMIFGYVVIVGILLIYILTLIIRTRRAKARRENQAQK